jgi:hypothetical protein
MYEELFREKILCKKWYTKAFKQCAHWIVSNVHNKHNILPVKSINLEFSFKYSAKIPVNESQMCLYALGFQQSCSLYSLNKKQTSHERTLSKAPKFWTFLELPFYFYGLLTCQVEGILNSRRSWGTLLSLYNFNRSCTCKIYNSNIKFHQGTRHVFY